MYYERVCITKTEKSRKRGPKGVNLKVRWRAKVAMRYCSEESAHRAILVWECRDRPPRRSVGKGACVCSCGYDPTGSKLRPSLDRNVVQVSGSCGPQSARAQFIVDAQTVTRIQDSGGNSL